MNRRRFPGVVVLVLALAILVVADQPRMNAARTGLNQAKAQLQSAARNKAGHRARAIEYINLAIGEINAGVKYDRRRHHAGQTEAPISLFVSADQPHMEKALDHLRQARTNLEAASADKGGHRVKAIGYVNSAIDEVKKGIDAGE